jgi:hypothetical protein
MVVTTAARIGLAFEGFDGYLSGRGAVILPDTRVAAGGGHVREILRAEVARPIIHLPSVVETIGHRAGHDRQT